MLQKHSVRTRSRGYDPMTVEELCIFYANGCAYASILLYIITRGINWFQRGMPKQIQRTKSCYRPGDSLCWLVRHKLCQPCLRRVFVRRIRLLLQLHNINRPIRDPFRLVHAELQEQNTKWSIQQLSVRKAKPKREETADGGEDQLPHLTY